MPKLKNVKTVFLDYDGTLHNSIGIYGPAFRKAYDYLINKGLAPERKWQDHEITIWLGYSPKEMWESFMPQLIENERVKASQIISDTMHSLIESGEPILYKGALETLDYLKSKGYKLVFISNCREQYMICHTKKFNLEHYFDTMICSELYDYEPKHEIVRKIRSQFPGEMVIVGDRLQDMEAGYENGIHTVGCEYGFGSKDELADAEFRISTIEELKMIL